MAKPLFSGTPVAAQTPPPGKPMFSGTPADDGVSPVPVDPNWGDDSTWTGKAYNYAREGLIGTAEGVADLPNIGTNAFNKGAQLYNAWFGKPGDPPPPHMEPKFQTRAHTIETLNPQTPGYEGTRQYGRMTGSALPFGPAAAIGAPAASIAGGKVGEYIDTNIDPNDRQRWQQTGEMAGPLIVGGISKAATAADLVPRPEEIGTALTEGTGALIGHWPGFAVARAVRPVVVPISRVMAGAVRPITRGVSGSHDTPLELFGRSVSPINTPRQGGW